MDIQKVIEKYAKQKNYIYIIVKTSNSRTSGLFFIENDKITYSNIGNDIFFELKEIIDSNKIENGVSIFRPAQYEYIKYYNPELFNLDLMELIIYQQYQYTPQKEERAAILHESIKREKIKKNLVYSCYIDDREEILIRVKTANNSDFNRKIQYTGTPLGFCAEHNNLDGFKIITESGGDLTKKSLDKNPIELAFEYSEDIVFYVYEKHFTQLQSVVQKRGFDLVLKTKNQKLYDLIYSINSDLKGKSKAFPYLHNFADYNNIFGLQYLLEKGADYNLMNIHKQTALDRAIRLNNKEAIQFLDKFKKSSI